jgi:hypothetical protein
MSVPGNFENGNTASFTLYCAGMISVVNPSVFRVSTPMSVSPSRFNPSLAISFAAYFASGRPIAFDTNGTVRLARGFTSIT